MQTLPLSERTDIELSPGMRNFKAFDFAGQQMSVACLHGVGISGVRGYGFKASRRMRYRSTTLFGITDPAYDVGTSSRRRKT